MEPAILYPKQEDLTVKLRRLFELHGFKKIQVSKFEEYSLYMDNRNFLDTQSIITFMDPDGKLMCLKPDVTLSIVRNTSRKSYSSFEKVYYIDEVCRFQKESREYKMIGQIGVELIGRTDFFSSMETVWLALESLRAISENHILDLSHLGFVSSLLDSMGLSHSRRAAVLEALHVKSTHHLTHILSEAGVSGENQARVLVLAGLSGPLSETLPGAEALIACEGMQKAYNDLARLARSLDQAGLADRVNLDFSVVNDLDYYSDLIFQGYIEGIPTVVLTGGRYDNLMKKMDKKNGAIGFAVSLSELGLHLRDGKTHDFDILIEYEEDCDCAALLQEVRALHKQGKSVRLEPAGADLSKSGVRCLERRRFTDGKGGAE